MALCVEWLNDPSAIRSFCKQSVPYVTKHLYIFEGLRSLSTQSHRLSSELAGVCHHLALSNSMVAKCKALHAKIWHRRSSKLGSCPRLAMPLCGNQRILLAQPGMGIWGADNRQAQFWKLLHICNDWIMIETVGTETFATNYMLQVTCSPWPSLRHHRGSPIEKPKWRSQLQRYHPWKCCDAKKLKSEHAKCKACWRWPTLWRLHQKHVKIWCRVCRPE